jgi:hypothetical protein
MDAAIDAANSLHDQANELYWNSSETVDQLAARLGMSRNALYGAVQPVAAGVVCTTCNEPLVFVNRSSRTAGRASCPGCGVEQQVDAAIAAAASAPAHDPNAVHPVPPPAEAGGTIEHLKESLGAVEPERAALIGGAAALGAAVGAAAVKALRRK